MKIGGFSTILVKAAQSQEASKFRVYYPTIPPISFPLLRLWSYFMSSPSCLCKETYFKKKKNHTGKKKVSC